MPYIRQEFRDRVNRSLTPESAGELNYLITRTIDRYLGNPAGVVKYAEINEAIGVLECAKLELYRRIAAPYEDEKRQENGDVFTCTKSTRKTES